MIQAHESASIPTTMPSQNRLKRLPWWALLLAAAGLVIIFLILNNDNYRDTFFYLQRGVATTLRMTFIAFPIATTIGLIAGLMRTSRNVVLFNISTLYVEIVRGIPLVVLLLYFAFAIVPEGIALMYAIGAWGLSWASGTFLEGVFTGLATFSIRNLSQELRAIIALSVAYGAFEAEVFRAGIQSIGKGQMEAARSLGMSYMQAMRYIILPQAIRAVLPPLGNDFIALLKDSSLATVLAVDELTQLSRLRRASTFRSLETYNVVAFLYLSMTLFLSALVRGLERYLKTGE